MAWAYQYTITAWTTRQAHRLIEVSAYGSEAAVRSFCNDLENQAGFT